MEWKINTAQYTCGELLYLGPWNVGGIHYDSARSKSDKEKYAATCNLPGIKNMLGHFKTNEEAKEKAENAVRHWLGKLPQQPHNASHEGRAAALSPGVPLDAVVGPLEG